jgi:hypothetical protein
MRCPLTTILVLFFKIYSFTYYLNLFKYLFIKVSLFTQQQTSPQELNTIKSHKLKKIKKIVYIQMYIYRVSIKSLDFLNTNKMFKIYFTEYFLVKKVLHAYIYE